MKKKLAQLEPIPTITKSEASYEKLMLQLMSKLVSETKENNQLIRQHYSNGIKSRMMVTDAHFKQKGSIANKKESSHMSQSYLSPSKFIKPPTVSQRRQAKSNLDSRNIIYESVHQSPSYETQDNERKQSQNNQQSSSKLQKILTNLQYRLQMSEELNKKLLEKIEKLQTLKNGKQPSHSKRFIENRTQSKQQDINMIEKAIVDKAKTLTPNNAPNQKKNYVILSQILPYSDRREMKVKFKISDVIDNDSQGKNEDLKVQTAEWLGMVYRATASICWNMLLNNYLNFEQVKILFTENIVFNFIQFIKDINKMGKSNMNAQLTSIINKKSVDILQFLCKQYPQTKIQAPNVTLRSILPQIDNQGRIKYDLVSRSGIDFSYREDGDYTTQIMKMVNFMIDRTNEEYDGFLMFMKDTFQEIFLPINRRKKFGIVSSRNIDLRELSHQDVMYKDKVKSYTKYLIGRKISKNTAKFTDSQIQDGIFFVKSSAILRIITKWVEELVEYFQKSQDKVKNSYSENKDHNGKMIYISALLKNGIHKQIVKQKEALMEKINKIRQQCQKMEYLLAGQQFTNDPTQVHLSQEQISVGMYCSNLKSAISTYICSQLNHLIHFLLKIPRQVSEENLGNDLEQFKSQARKDLDSVNLVTLKLFDLLRCKIHSNEQQIIWIVQYLLDQNQINKEKFNIVRIKDRLNLGTRDIMINAQINRGVACQIQLAVTSNSDKKQELLDQYNHFLYELKRSELGPVTENVSIWSNLQQRYMYFQQLMKDKAKKRKNIQKQKPQKHSSGGIQQFEIFKRPIICKCCNSFFAIPQTCLLNVRGITCSATYCGECYYYNFLDQTERKQFIFDKHRIIKPDVLSKLVEYTDYTKPLPPTGFFIKKKFLKKQLSFYMAIEKNKNEKIRDAPSIQLIVVQTIVRDGTILNRQVNKNEIQARLEKGEFYVKNYQKTQLNNFIIFYFDKKQNKKLMTLKDIHLELQKPENRKTKILSIVSQPSYISDLKLLKKQSEKIKQMNSLSKVIKDEKVVVYLFNNYLILAQACVKGSVLRAQITKKVNISTIKSFIEKESDIITMQFKNMTNQFQQIATKFKPKLYNSFCQTMKKLFISNGNIESIKCFSNFVSLQAVFINQNKLKSLQGIQNLKNLMSFKFEDNQVDSLLPFANCTSMRYIYGNTNKLTNLKGLQNLKDLKCLSVYQNQITSIEQIKDCTNLQELYIRQNPITDISAVRNLTELQKLFVGNTKVVNLPDLTPLQKLKSLSLDFLNLTNIPPIFKNLRLRELWLSNNKIEKITNLQNQTELVFLTLSNNNISKLQNLATLQNLQTLRLNSNNITVIEGVKDLDSLKVLSLQNNPINDIKEIAEYDITFKFKLSLDKLSEKANKQLVDLQISKSAVSSSQD